MGAWSRAAVVAFGVAMVMQGIVARQAHAACGDDSGDAAAIAAARSAIDVACDCAGVATHGAYVRCAAGIAAARVATGHLRAECKGSLKRCAARSTCGRPDSVTCCRTNARGRLKCSVKSNADRCRAPKGGTACVGATSSCCDACGSGDCVPTTSSSSTTTSTSTTSSTITTACGETWPTCNGSCPTGMHCGGDENFPPTSCACIPDGVTLCGSSTYPTCGGTCSGSGVCAPVQIYTLATGTVRACTCVDPAADCTGNFLSGMCPGLCPAGKACYGEPEPAGLGGCVGCIPSDFFP